MKIKGLLISMLACTTLVGCSSNDEPEVDNNQKMEGDAYVVVKFAMPGEAKSRALETNFAEGTKAEVDVDKAIFYFLDENGNGCAVPSEYAGSAFTWTDGTNNQTENVGTGNSVDQTSNVIVVIRNPINVPKYIVAVLNADNPFSANSMPSLDQLKAKFDDYYTNGKTEGKFVMSNAVWVDDNSGVIIGEEIMPDQLLSKAPSAADDLSKPVVINVERVLAKVTVATANAVFDDKEADWNLQGKITGYWLSNTADNSYLIKNLKASYSNDELSNGSNKWWNDVDNQRSYWANSYSNATYEKRTYSAQTTTPWYCHENTSTTPTQAVVAVQWKVGTTADGTTTYEAKDLVRWRSKLYLADNFKTEVANQYQNTYKIMTTSTDADNKTTYSFETIQSVLSYKFNTSESIVEGLENHQAKLIVNSVTGENKSLVKVLTTETDGKPKTWEVTTVAAIQTELNSNVGNFDYWTDGQAYYYTDILHSLDKETGSTLTGVVRNHLYQLNITEVVGLGTPVPAVDVVITPEKPTQVETYITAKINIFSYKVVPQQDVTLQ